MAINGKVFFRLGGTCLLLAVLAGCYKATVPNKPAGFLDNYESLRPVDNDIGTLYFENNAAAWNSYHSIIMDPIGLHYIPEARERDLDQDKMRKLGEYFRNAMIEAVEDKYTIVDESGHGVMHLRAAITDAKPTNVAANIVSKTLIYVPVDMGEAAIEGELLDSVTGERLAAIVDRKVGSLFSPSLGYMTWGHVKDAFRSWAHQLRDVLDRKPQYPRKT
ncbi:MAG: DUF3313 domain-containing protein [Pseudomonadota bacterium]